MKTCARCGKANPDRSSFCMECGERLPETGGPGPENRRDDETALGSLGGTATGMQGAGTGAAIDGDASRGAEEARVPGPRSGNGESRAAGSTYAEPQSSDAPQTVYAETSTGAAASKGLDDRKKAIIAAAAAVAAVLVVVVLAITISNSSKRTIDVTEGLSLGYDGPSGYATAYVDGCTWQDDVYWYLDSKYDGDTDKVTEQLALLYGAVTYGISPEEGLANGDTVTVTVTIDEDLIADLPIELVGSDMTFEVSGLQEVEVLDLFANLALVYEGYAPFASAEIDEGSYDGLDDLDIDFSCDVSTGLSNGDVVTVSASYDEDELLDAGYIVEDASKQVTVDGLSSYYMTLADIPDEAMDKMKAQAESEIEAIAGEWNGEYRKLSGKEYIGSYFLTPKFDDIGLFDFGNRVALVYKVSAWDDDEGDFSYYMAYYFDDVTELADGSYSVDIEACDDEYNSFTTEGSIVESHYVGYRTLDSLFAKYVTAYADEYEYETDIQAE